MTEAGMIKEYQKMEILKDLVNHPRELSFVWKSGYLSPPIEKLL